VKFSRLKTFWLQTTLDPTDPNWRGEKRTALLKTYFVCVCVFYRRS